MGAPRARERSGSLHPYGDTHAPTLEKSPVPTRMSQPCAITASSDWHARVTFAACLYSLCPATSLLAVSASVTNGATTSSPNPPTLLIKVF